MRGDGTYVSLWAVPPFSFRSAHQRHALPRQGLICFCRGFMRTLGWITKSESHLKRGLTDGLEPEDPRHGTFWRIVESFQSAWQKNPRPCQFRLILSIGNRHGGGQLICLAKQYSFRGVVTFLRGDMGGSLCRKSPTNQRSL